jgi:hypothetical protein
VFAFLLALLAIRDSTGKPLLFEMFKASGVIGKLAVKVIDRVPQMLWNRLARVHDARRLPFSLRDVKG